MDMPLEAIHKLAFKAAEAANCAGEQGKYWEMHDRLFVNQKALEPWVGHAQAVGLDVAAFEQCLTSGKSAPKIRRDMAEAARSATSGTPAFMIGRTDPKTSRMKILAVLRGARDYPDFKVELDRLLAEPEKLAAGGRDEVSSAPARLATLPAPCRRVAGLHHAVALVGVRLVGMAVFPVVVEDQPEHLLRPEPTERIEHRLARRQA